VRAFDTRRWLGIAGVALVALGVGVAVRRPAAALAGVVAVGYAAVARAGGAPTPELRLRRSLDATDPEPGERVTATVTARNAGDRLVDLRLVDGVPPGLAVVDGAPRHATALPPGGEDSFSYAVRAARGSHGWGPATAVTRNLAGSRERVAEVEAEPDADAALRCAPRPGDGIDLPPRGLTTPHAGRVATDAGGPGVEFHAVREYRRGDPARRIDWKRLARTGDPATVAYRRRQVATVMLVVDAREAAYRAPGPGAATAVERSVDAAAGLLAALAADGNRVGLTALSPTPLWLAPGTGRVHAERARRLLAESPAFGAVPPGSYVPLRRWERRARRRLPEDAQAVLLSPACDDGVVRLALRLQAAGRAVTLVSPDPTDPDGATPGRRLAAVDRSNRLRRLRAAGVRVVDWGGEPLAAAVRGRWSG